MKTINDKALLEILADIEHKRWSDWQSYVHSLCIKNDDGSLTIPAERVEWWNKEIQTSYFDLTEELKQYDRDEVMKTLDAINQYINQDLNELKKEHSIMKQILIENNLWETLLNDDRFIEYLKS